ncbi:hypothetical protein PV08_05167 [Exophiala spinifera]|uniref:EthD domain-containing protein n=1 Tax=Exophiala spinifera TaxID=91928 RepID=A0A0D1ZZ85_9EURO|nr:uncharacterized protein PV08_05167 [Exophiala spinifera]KIW17972.1 hypothetical protein PV08_05167 [Exophiala spinifera]
MDHLAWDGASEFYVAVDEWDNFVKFMNSDKFKTVLAPDGAKFATPPMKIIVSREIVVEDVAAGKLCRGS